MPEPCCYRAALDLDAGYCDGCGTPLLRCAAFEECGGLLDPQGTCAVCLAPALHLDAGSVREAQVGGALTLPLVLANTADVGRPLFLKGAWTREADGAWEPADLPWDRLEGGDRAPLPVRARALHLAGEHRVEIGIALATRWRWREEVVAYTAGVAITVEGREELTVQQNITYGAETPGSKSTIYAPLKVQGAERRTMTAEARPRPLPLTRATRLERVFGLRGDPNRPSVPRSTRLAWRGFEAGTCPADGPIVTADGVLYLGRSRARATGGTNDARLLAATADGALDESASRSISRRHVALCIQNDRLVLRVESDRGAWVNDRAVPRGTCVALHDGDRFSPLPRGQGHLSLQVRFEEHHGVVETITLERRPTPRRGA